MFNFSLKNKTLHAIIVLGCSLATVTINETSAQTPYYPQPYYSNHSPYTGYTGYQPVYTAPFHYNQAYPMPMPMYNVPTYPVSGYALPRAQQHVVQQVTVEQDANVSQCDSYDMSNGKVYEPVKTMYGHITYTETATPNEYYAHSFCHGDNRSNVDGGYVMDLRKMFNSVNNHNSDNNGPDYTNLPFNDAYTNEQYHNEDYDHLSQRDVYYQALEAQNKQLREYYDAMIQQQNDMSHNETMNTSNEIINTNNTTEKTVEEEVITEEISIDDIE